MTKHHGVGTRAATFALHAGTNTTTGLSQLGPATRGITAVLVQADPDNSGNVLVGNFEARSIVLVPGAAVTIEIDRLDRIWISQGAGDQTGWLASA